MFASGAAHSNPEHGSAAVHVRDHGRGIVPEEQARVFEEFVPFPGVAPGGTDLGLAIWRRLAERLGGTPTGELTAGAGSTFAVRLSTR